MNLYQPALQFESCFLKHERESLTCTIVHLNWRTIEFKIHLIGRQSRNHYIQKLLKLIILIVIVIIDNCFFYQQMEINQVAEIPSRTN